jgi:protocatechuate 3,4-dioxygenase beta subunit
MIRPIQRHSHPRLGRERLCLCLLVACIAAAKLGPLPLTAAEEDRCAIAGAVHDSFTGAPLRKMNVVLYPAGGRTTYTAATNSVGAFSFDSVEPGKYRIALEHAGYVSAPGNQAGALTHLDPGQKLNGLELTAVPLGAISGTILDADGEPILEAAVHVIRPKWWHGRRVGVEVKSALANDLGRYRMDSLEPGEYCIRANRTSSWFDVGVFSDGPGQPEMAATPVFYPHAVTIAGASALYVGAGQEIAGIDLRLPIERTFHVRGTVFPPPTDTFTNKAPFVKASHDDGGVKDWAEFFGRIGSDGSFDMAGIPSGNYLIQETQGSQPLTDSARVSIDSGDVSGVRLAVTRFDITIQASFEGDASHDLSKWFARLEPVDRTGAALATWPNRPGVISNVSPGRYVLEVSTNENAYVKKLLVRGKEITDLEFELNSADDHLEIVLAKGTQVVAGTFAWPDPRPKGASAILVPEQPRPGGFTSVYHADIDQSGEFILRSVSPGRYRSFVVTNFDGGLWENRDLFRLVADQGVALEVPENPTDNSAARVKPTLLPVAVMERAIAQTLK